MSRHRPPRLCIDQSLPPPKQTGLMLNQVVFFTHSSPKKKNISFGKHPVYMPSVVHSSIFSKSYPPPLEHSTRRPSIRISTHLILKTSISVFLYRIAKSIFSLVEHYQQKFPVNLHFHQQKTSTKLS